MSSLLADRLHRRFPFVTTALVLVSVAVFAFELTLPRYGLTRQGFYAKVGAVPFELAHGYDVPPADLVPWWATAFTALTIHGGWLHLAFNVLYLAYFGAGVEERIGGLRFFGLFLVCGIVATAAQVVAATGSTVPVIGASGAVAGVLGAYLALRLRAGAPAVSRPGGALSRIPVPARILLAVWSGLLVLQGVFAFGHTQVAVAFFAHVAGLVAGLALAVPLGRRGRRERGGDPGVRRAPSV